MKKSLNNFVLYWVEKNLYSDSGVDELVGLTGYSRRSLENFFLHENGLSIGSYILKRKMSRAALMLRITHIPINEIAHLFHYHNGQNFSRAFRNYTGLTPTDYRNAPQWNNRALQAPLLNLTPEFSPEIVTMEKTFMIAGKKINYATGFTSVDDKEFTKYVIPCVDSLFSGDTQSLWISACLNKRGNLAENRDGLTNIDVTVGYPLADVPAANIETKAIPAGKYAKLTFSGSLEDYLIFSRIAYIKTLTEYNVSWQGNSTFIEVVEFNMEKSEIGCNIYIPISETTYP
ncbi:TPA: helix-turn-helix domain-containing protein [Citrobacter freundii]